MEHLIPHDLTPRRFHDGGVDGLTSHRLQSRDVNATWLHEKGQKSSRLERRAVDGNTHNRPQRRHVEHLISHNFTSRRLQHRDVDEPTSRRFQGRDDNALWLEEGGRESSRLESRAVGGYKPIRPQRRDVEHLIPHDLTSRRFHDGGVDELTSHRLQSRDDNARWLTLSLIHI